MPSGIYDGCVSETATFCSQFDHRCTLVLSLPQIENYEKPLKLASFQPKQPSRFGVGSQILNFFLVYSASKARFSFQKPFSAPKIARLASALHCTNLAFHHELHRSKFQQLCHFLLFENCPIPANSLSTCCQIQQILPNWPPSDLLGLV